MMGRFGEEEVDHGVELELVERLAGEVRIGRRHERVEADRQQALDGAVVDRFDQLLRRQALAGDVGFVAVPHLCHRGTVLGVGDVTVAGQLVALVAVLATTLAVALPGDRRHPATGFAELAGGEPEVDRGEDVVDPFGVLLDPAGVQHHPGRGRAPQLCSFLDPRRRDPGDAGRPGRCHVSHGCCGVVEVDGVVVDEVVVEPVAFDQHMEHSAEQRRVGARTYGQEQVRCAGEWDDSGVLDDQLGAPVTCPPDVTGGDRERLGDVRTGDPHHIGERDVAPRVRCPVDAERLLVPGAGRHHAEAAVVVQVRGVQREAGELSDEIALLVRQRNAGQHRERVVPVLGLDAFDRGHDLVEGLIPGDVSEPARCGGVAFHRMQQPVRVTALEVALDTFRAELAFVERELVPRFEPDDRVVVDLQLDTALLTAEAAVRVDDLVDGQPGVPSARRSFVEVRPVTGDQFLVGDRWSCHQPNPPTRAD